MKNLRLILAAFVAVSISLVLTSCQPDSVAPSDKNSPGLLLDAANPHPLPDPLCSPIDTINLISESGSEFVNYCGSYNNVPLPCPPSMPRWGYVELLNGRDVMIANFSMGIGWFIDVSRSKFGPANAYSFDGNGIPSISTDWIATDLAVVQNKWQLSLNLADLPSPCFEMALNLTAVKLDFFSGVDVNSTVSLWGYNPMWSDSTSKRSSSSPYLTPWCPTACAPVLPPADTSCIVAYPGLPDNAGCLDLTPDVSGATGNVTYNWSTGATTPSINVCPTQNTDYAVTVTDGNGPYAVRIFNVVTEDVICTPGNRPSPKVLVCHYPPGNPNNPQTICIDWSGVPAHVEAYRTPQMNPNHGHDSGCHIGPCHSNPCAN